MPNPTYHIEAHVITEQPPINNNILIFQFTRHAPSCNNINFGKFYAINKDFEPGIVWLGIIKIINLMNSKHDEQYKKSFDTYQSNVVCVSNLYRTWLTAFLMHGTHNKEVLNIIVCPYLKELHKRGIKRGNYPKDVRHTFFKFKKFLDSLYNVFVNNTNNSEKNIFFEKIKKYNTPTETLNYTPEFYKSWYETLPKTINFYLLSAVVENTPYIITIKKDAVDGVYKFIDVINITSNFCKMKQILGADTRKLKFNSVQVEGYTKNGNLEYFGSWYCKNEQSIINATTKLLNRDNFINNTLSVITHSNIMKQFIYSKFIDKVTLKDKVKTENLKEYEKVKHHNSWSFNIYYYLDKPTGVVMREPKKFITTPGVLIEDGGVEQKKAIEIERIMQKFSLCGKNGSVKNECLSSSESSLNDDDDRHEGLSVGGLLRTKKRKYKGNTKKNKIIKIRSKKLH